MRLAMFVSCTAIFLSCLVGTATAQETFHGYECTVDCSGHQAGYDWAEERGITDPSDCGGNSESFIEGCQAYAGEDGPYSDEDQRENGDEDDDGDVSQSDGDF